MTSFSKKLTDSQVKALLDILSCYCENEEADGAKESHTYIEANTMKEEVEAEWIKRTTDPGRVYGPICEACEGGGCEVCYPDFNEGD